MRIAIYGLMAAMLFASAARADGLADAGAGWEALNRGDYATAVRLFTSALNDKLSPTDKELAYVKRAQAYLGEKQNTLAVADLGNALALNPNDTEALDLLQKAKGAGDGPSLAETLNFIVENVAAQGTINYASMLHDAANNSDWVNQFSSEVSNVRANTESCEINYHRKAIANGNVASDRDAGVSFKDVKSVRILSMAQNLNETDAAAGHPTWSSQINPPVTVVSVMRGVGENVFNFKDEDTANRVAKALLHAATLCGGGKQLF